MAAPAENLLSLGHRTGNKNTFTKHHHSVKRSEAMHLRRCLQDLKDRERRAQEHNRQLLQQFEKAQDALKEMLARNAAMKTIRMEYERYLEENSLRWQQQLQEKTQAAQKKRMEDCLRTYLKTEDQVLASTVDGPLLSQGPSTRPQKSVAPQVYSTPNESDYNQDNSSYHPYPQSSWLTPTGRFPGFLRASDQSHNPFLFPPPTFLHPDSVLPQHLTSTPSHHHLWSRQDGAGGDPGPRAAGIPPGSLGQLHTEELPASRAPQAVEEHEETSRAPSSNREEGGGSRRCLSPDLDIKPVRLSSSHAESSESDRDSSLASRGKTKRREKRGRTQHSSSDSERHCSQKSSRTSSKIVTALFSPPQSSDRNNSSEEASISVPVVSPQSEKGTKEQTRRNEEEESEHTHEEEGSSNEESPSEKVGNQSHADKSESGGAEQESGRNNVKTDTRAEEETDNQEGSSSEQSSISEKDEGDKQKNPGPRDQEETENSQKSEEQSSDVEEDEVSTTKETEEEAEVRMEHQGEDEERPNMLKNKDTEIQKQGSASSQDEEDGNEDRTEQDEEGSHEEDEEESGDSEDIIISPQDKRSKQIQVISEVDEDEEENKSQSSNENSNDEDIENLLTPQEQTEENDSKAVGKPEVIRHNMDIFQRVEEKSKTGNKSDSESDHFYD